MMLLNELLISVAMRLSGYHMMFRLMYKELKISFKLQSFQAGFDSIQLLN